MDPNALMKFFLEFVDEGEWEDAGASLADLHAWLDKGGFAPNINRIQLIALIELACDGANAKGGA